MWKAAEKAGVYVQVKLGHEVLAKDVLGHRRVCETLDDADTCAIALVDDEDGLVDREALLPYDNGELNLRVAGNGPGDCLAGHS